MPDYVYIMLSLAAIIAACIFGLGWIIKVMKEGDD